MTRALGLGVALALLGCSASMQENDWRLHFEDPTVRDRSRSIEALVLGGGCDGALVYRAEVPIDRPGPMPPVLDRGRYGLAGLARDESCATIARGCVSVVLPLPSSARVVVPLAAVDEGPACPASACVRGRCEGDAELDASFPADGGVELPDAGPDLDAGGTDAAIPDASSPCDLYLDDRCYRLGTTNDTWDAAERACVVWGGHLVTLDSAAEEAAVEAQLGAGHWIGLTDATTEGTFVWADGTALGYARWSTDAPRATPPWRDCVQHTAAGWLDGRCTDLHSFVCER